MKRFFIFTALLGCAACGAAKNSDGSSGSSTTTPGSTGTGPGNGTGSTSSSATTTPGPQVRFIGRTSDAPSGGTLLAWSGTAVETRFTGTQLSVNLANAKTGQPNRMAVVVDGVATAQTLTITDGTASYPITLDGGTHTVTLVKMGEAGNGQVIFTGFTAVSGTQEKNTLVPNRLIEFVGDSITAGYGIDGSGVNACTAQTSLYADPAFENASEAYGPTVARSLKADWSLVAWSGLGVYQNRDGSLGTATDPVVPQIWPLIDPTDTTSTWGFAVQPDAVVVDLGTNDFVKAFPDQAAFTAAYVAFGKNIRSKYPKAAIVLAIGPMLTDYSSTVPMQDTTGKAYVQGVVTALNQAGDKKVSFLDFAANSTDVGCEYHPNVAGAQKMATTAGAALQQLLGWK